MEFSCILVVKVFVHLHVIKCRVLFFVAMHCPLHFILQLSLLFLLQLFFILAQEIFRHRADVVSVIDHCILLLLYGFERLQTSILV